MANLDEFIHRTNSRLDTIEFNIKRLIAEPAIRYNAVIFAFKRNSLHDESLTYLCFALDDPKANNHMGSMITMPIYLIFSDRTVAELTKVEMLPENWGKHYRISIVNGEAH